MQDFMAQLKERGKQMREEEIWDVLVAVLLALDYIHNTHHIIHR